MKTTTPSKYNLLILASTFPRWSGDSTPPFVLHFAQNIAAHFNHINVIVPHYKNAKTHEYLDKNIAVKRFHYFAPASQETIAYDGGAVNKINKSPLYVVKLLCFIAALFFNTLTAALFKKIRIINAHWIIPQGFVAVLVKLIAGTKVVVTVHGGDVYSLNGGLMRKIKRFILKYADEVVVNSHATQALCHDIYPRAYHIIPMGVDVHQFTPKAPSQELTKQYGLGDFTILFVGRLSQEKGVMYLCQALKLLKDAHVGYKALIVGSGPEENKIRRFIAANQLDETVILTGWVDSSQLVDYYSVADVVAGPSLKEAFGLAFAEAQACGVPVVASDVGGISDIIQTGVTGFLTKERSPEDMCDKLRRLAEDQTLRSGMAIKARERIVANYSWETVEQSYLKVFDTL